LNALKTKLTEKYPTFEINEIGPPLDAEEAHDSLRNQYHSTRILAILEQRVRAKAVDMLLGITSHDLYVPGMNFVFGESRLPGPVAIVSTHRLNPRSRFKYALFQARVVKEAVHEIGHMLGLMHCEKDECVMYFSQNLDDTDRKRSDYCSECRYRLGRV